MDNRYRLLGVIIKSRTLTEKRRPRATKGVYDYLNFIVERPNAFGIKRPAYVETILQRGVYENGVVVRPQLVPSSTRTARICMGGANYREITEQVEIDLDTQAICQCHKGIVILDAEALHRYKITLRGLVKSKVQEYMDRHPGQPEDEKDERKP